MKIDELKTILGSHRMWLEGEGGERANLRYAQLFDANLRGANLRYAQLSIADLKGANLRGADLSNANLSGADLSGANLFCANLRDACLSNSDLVGSILRGADLRGANMVDADLRGANLRYADLSNADLRGVTGNLAEIKSICAEKYTVTYTASAIQIGCENHAISAWWGFNDERIAKMDKGALDWWKKWKSVLQQIIEISPAIPTGYEGSMK